MKLPILVYGLAMLTLASCSVQGGDPPALEADEELELVRMVDDSGAEPPGMEPMVNTALEDERPLLRLPDTPQGYRAQAMLDALMADDDEQLQPFLEEHYDPDFLVQVPQNDHKALLRQLQQHIRHSQIGSVSSLQHEYRIELLDSDAEQNKVLDIYFQPAAPYKIAGVRLL
ncbi:hypothetical protein [Cesiribacter andamanensis]|nr:hypothetical protein [Cesiribacter andamanensis]